MRLPSAMMLLSEWQSCPNSIRNNHRTWYPERGGTDSRFQHFRSQRCRAAREQTARHLPFNAGVHGPTHTLSIAFAHQKSMTTRPLESDLIRAATLIANADAVIITAGAGMGVDSGLPDFRGPGGFWKHYPALAEAGLKFSDIACPQAFEDNPERAWGFYGHRLDLYRRTVPHLGFQILLNIADRLARGAFVFTSNVDGHFQKAGFPQDRIYECHGSIHHLQCFAPCSHKIWEATFDPEVDEARCHMTSPLPRCPDCARLARPNIMMFHDWGWFDERSRAQALRLRDWRNSLKKPVVIELGAGKDIPTVRLYSEEQGRWAPLIRINPRESQRPGWAKGVSISLGALEAMNGISDALFDLGFWDGA